MISKKREEELTKYGIEEARTLFNKAYEMGLTWETLSKNKEFMCELQNRIISAITRHEKVTNSESGRYKFTHEKMGAIISEASGHEFDMRAYYNSIFEQMFERRSM